MIPVRKVIEDALDLGVDTEELIDTLKENGWHLVHGPDLQRWSTKNQTEVFAYIGAVDEQKVVVKEVVSDRQLAHMPIEGVEHLKRYLLVKWSKELVRILGKAQS